MLAFVLAALSAAPALPPDGIYNYNMNIRGQTLGKTTLTLSSQPSGITIAEKAAGGMGEFQNTGSATLTLDGGLVPTKYSASYQTARGAGTVSVSFTGNTANETSTYGNESFTLSEDAKHFVVLDGTLFAGLFLLPSQMQAWSSPSVYAIAPMFGRGGPIAADTTLKPDRPKGIAATDGVIAVSSPVEFIIWYDPKTLIVNEVDIPAQNAVYKRTK